MHKLSRPKSPPISCRSLNTTEELGAPGCWPSIGHQLLRSLLLDLLLYYFGSRFLRLNCDTRILQHTQTHTNTHKRTHAHTRTHTNTHAHTRTHTQGLTLLNLRAHLRRRRRCSPSRSSWRANSTAPAGEFPCSFRRRSSTKVAECSAGRRAKRSWSASATRDRYGNLNVIYWLLTKTLYSLVNIRDESLAWNQLWRFFKSLNCSSGQAFVLCFRASFVYLWKVDLKLVTDTNVGSLGVCSNRSFLVFYV